VDQPNCENADRAFLHPDPLYYHENTAVADFFLEAEAAIADGSVTQEELTLQAQFDSWGIYFRVDDDRLSSMGSDVYFSQDEYGYGTISTTDRYWLEKKVDGRWEPVPEVRPDTAYRMEKTREVRVRSEVVSLVASRYSPMKM
jgi:hypothetical protein